MDNRILQFYIGVDDYTVMLPKVCSENPSLVAHLQFSFRLTGDFLQAAFDDDIKKTIDYDALSSFIHQSIATKNCSSLPEFIPNLKSQVLHYAPLISGGRISLSFHCHDAFRFEIDLL